jgi:hypothetical protein
MSQRRAKFYSVAEATGCTAPLVKKPQAVTRSLGALREIGGSFRIEKYSSLSFGISSLTSRCTFSRLITNAKARCPLGLSSSRKPSSFRRKTVLPSVTSHQSLFLEPPPSFGNQVSSRLSCSMALFSRPSCRPASRNRCTVRATTRSRFDEMVRNRALSDELLSRFLTTAMLPKLARINKERRILFIVATNYIHSFDVAISRAGRFDLVLQMMPPLVSEKMKKWPKELEALKSIVDDKDFNVKLADLTFLETEAIARRFKRLGDPPEAQSAQDLWTEVIAQCTLKRGNERAGAKQQLMGGMAFSGPEATTSDCPPSWKDTAIQEVEFIRLN